MKLTNLLAELNIFGKDKKSLLPGTIKETPLFKKITAIFKENRVIGVIYLDIARFHDLEQIHGQELADRIIKSLYKILENNVPRLIPSSELLDIHNLWGDDFVIYFAPKNKPSAGQLFELAAAIKFEVKNHLNNSMPKHITTPVDLHVGHSLATPSTFRMENQIYNAVKAAYRMAKDMPELHTIQLIADLKELIENKAFTMVYQPIVSLKTGRTLGWEALTRGPDNSHFYSPGVLFPFAEEVDLLYPLEKTTRELAINQTQGLPAESLLFLNLNPRTINDPEFVRGETKKILEKMGLSPQNIVFEITERSSISDFKTFKRTLEYYRSQGYQIAVDDAGAGYSSLQSIAEIHPDFIKMDMSLIRGIANNPVKKALLETFVTFAQKINCEIIAEGIETPEELLTLTSMGIHYGQGYYLAKPANTLPYPEEKVLKLIYRGSAERQEAPSRKNLTLGEIAQDSPSVRPDVTVRQVRDIFEGDPMLNGIVVTSGVDPKGLIMRQNLNYHLGSQYGAALYFERPINTIMDSRPLMLPHDTNIDLAAQIAMNRTGIKLYDYIIVIRNNCFAGVVSIQNLLDNITRIKMDLAKWSNPLTGLPGNPQIEEELAIRLHKGVPFTVVYADLDKFKSYNDHFGFECGDKVILFASRLISHMVKRYGTDDDFVGHIGGDDFIFITHPDKTDELASRIIKGFDRLVPRFYTSHRISKYQKTISISMAAVECHEDLGMVSRLHLGEIAAELKKTAKNTSGSICIKECLRINQ